MSKVLGQDKLTGSLDKLFKIYIGSEGKIRPHFFLTGESGSGKTITIKAMCAQHSIEYVEINAAGLTKEGTSGNSLSKALTPLMHIGNKPVVVFADEFDKLFISGNNNNDLAHETTNGVQNEFLKVLESDTAAVFGDYGKYVNANVGHVLFCFAGAFNGTPDIDLDKLRQFGIKTEFLGRVGLVFNTEKLSLDTMYSIVDNCDLLTEYCTLIKKADREKTAHLIKAYIRDNHANNTIGARLINTLVHQYFITGELNKKQAQKLSFQKQISFE